MKKKENLAQMNINLREIKKLHLLLYDTSISIYQSKKVHRFILDGVERFGSNSPELFLQKDVLRICSKFAGEQPCQSVISISIANAKQLY